MGSRGDGVKISININENFSDTEIVINSGALTPEIERIIATLRILDQQITVIKNDESYILDVAKIVYIYLPADATVVGAFIRYAFKIVIV